MLVCSAWEEVDIIFDKNAQRAQNYFFITGTKGQMSSCTINFNRPMSAADWGNFLHFFPSNWMSCKLQLFKLWKSLIVLPQEQYNKTSSRFEIWRAHLCCFSKKGKIALFTEITLSDCHIWPNWLLTPNIKRENTCSLIFFDEGLDLDDWSPMTESATSEIWVGAR